MKKKLPIFIIGSLLLSGITVAQIPDIRYEKYTMQDGLTQNSTGALLKDSHGFLWIGTSWGLNRYDGRVIKQYNKIGTNFLPDLGINSIAEDKDGNIWIATPTGLGCMNPYTEKFTNYKEGTGPQTIPHGFCYVYADKQKNIWVADSYSISLFDPKTKTFTTYPVTTAGKDPRINKYIDRFFEDSKGRFWLETSYGIKLFDRAAKTYLSYHFDDTDDKNIGKNATHGIFEDKAGNIWVGTWNVGLLKFDPGKNIFENFQLIGEPFQLLNNVSDINAITLNNHYYLLLATSAGLVLADPLKLSPGKLPVERIISESTDVNNESPAGKSSILKDDQNIYWVSGDDGLGKIDMGNQVFQWNPLPDKSFLNTEIFHVIPDITAPRQKLFLTTQKGWWQYDLITQAFNQYNLPERHKELLSNINHFIIVENGYWFTSQVGVGFYNPTTNVVKEISSLVSERMDNKVRTGFICKDGLGRIWFSVYRSGIRIYDPKTEKLVALFADSTQPGNLYSKSIFDLEQAADGSILITSGEKLYQVDPGNLSFHITDPEKANLSSIERTGPRKILFDKKNRTLLLAKQLIYSYQHGKLIQLYPYSGLADLIMEDFLQDGNGDFWITTNLGLFKTDTAFKEWVNMSDKIPVGRFDKISEIFRTQNDEFILAAAGKIGVFSLPALSRNNRPPIVVINRLRTGKTEQYLVSLKQKPWDISFKDAIEIEVSAINFSNEKGNRIYYQLEGRDNDWEELTGNPVIRYDQLPPGNYIFKVKAMNGDAVWSKETILSFKVLPPFWITWWFIGLCVLAISGILYAFYRYRLRQLIREERLRSHIATDLHDDIGATLSSISIYSEAIKQQTTALLPQLTPMLDKMGETSREMVGNMSDIVWAINPENDSFEKMLSRMQNLAAELCAVKNILLYFTADEKLNHLQLNMKQRRNIYLIFKEALNNALKYANCRNMRVEIRKENRLVVLSVKDDGKGFPEVPFSENRRGGEGLKNMQHRAAEINGELTIETGENKGTHILLKANIT
ncbi:MAG TPA: two-component regulator propeller domain-containing protein [Chitinophagaceae bacterium]|nr:two-component regulator propeller domain-containing protein [Chitinophagaceae bacterium]